MTDAIRRYTPTDQKEVSDLLDRVLGGRHQARLGELVDVLSFPTILGVNPDGAVVGVASYRAIGAAAELVALAADPPSRGVGTRLIEAVLGALGAIERIWLVTTNDNLPALRFYQRRGFRIVGVEANGVDRARLLKPSIPTIGHEGIELHDELILERRLR